jgi:hypothetical protein
MFADTEDRINASEVAGLQVKLHSTSIAFRVRLQRVIDAANQLPLSDGTSDPSTSKQRHVTSAMLGSMCENLKDVLAEQQKSSSQSRKRPRSSTAKSDSASDLWTEINELMSSMKESWGEVIDKFHARAFFGSEKKKAKLKTFNQSIWEQVRLLKPKPSASYDTSNECSFSSIYLDRYSAS